MDQPLKDFITSNPIILTVVITTCLLVVFGFVFEIIWHLDMSMPKLPSVLQQKKTHDEQKEGLYLSHVNQKLSAENIARMEQEMREFGSKLSTMSENIERLARIIDYKQAHPTESIGNNNGMSNNYRFN